MALTYPVDTTKRYTIWDTNTTAPFTNNGRPRSGIEWPNTNGDPIPDLPANWRILLDVQDAKPAYDAETQKLESVAPVADLVAETYTRGWNVVALTQEELDAKAREADIEATRQTMKVAYGKLMDGTATADQVRKIVAWLLKREGLDINGEPPPAPDPEI